MILVLSCMPCSDAGKVSYRQDRNLAASTTDHTSGHTDEHQDLCSPFCQCSCCSLAYALPILSVPAAAPAPAFGDKTFAALIQQCPAGIALPVWQPPQLS